MKNADSLISKIFLLTRSKKEFDIVPHFDGDNHLEILEADDAFALCSCLSGETLWRPTYRTALKLKSSISIGTLIDIDNSLDSLTFLLLFSPSCLTFWHCRKQLVLDNTLSLADELAYTRLILSRFPRSTETLQHRHWILDRLTNEEFMSVFDDEVVFCELLADKHRCNYMVWQHRRWLLERLGISPEILYSQLKRMDDWNAHHPLDISGWAFRDYLLRICQRSLPREDFEQLLTTELVTARDLVEKTPENDALWWFMEQITQAFLETHHDMVKLKELDPFVQILPAMRDLPDKELKNVDNIDIPAVFSKSWASFLYKRFLRWLSQITKSDGSDS